MRALFPGARLSDVLRLMVNLAEFIIILLTIGLIFGLGKLGDIGRAIARMRTEYEAGLGEQPHTMPEQTARRVESAPPAGRAEPAEVEDAVLDDPPTTRS